MEREPARSKPVLERWPSFLAGLVFGGCLCLILSVVLPRSIAWKITFRASPFAFLFVLLGSAFLGGWSIGRGQKWVVWIVGGSMWIALAWMTVVLMMAGDV